MLLIITVENFEFFSYITVTIVIVVCLSISLCLMKLLTRVVVIKMFMREQPDHSSKQYSTGKYSG